MRFQPLHFADKITVINPEGFVGLLTLWSKPEYVLRKLDQAGVDLSEKSSKIAAVGTHYGAGLRELLRNLAHNPQIRVLAVLGRNRSESLAELQAFFENGVEPLDSESVAYELGGESVPVARVAGTGRIVDALTDLGMFAAPPRLVWLGEPDDVSLDELADAFAAFSPDGAVVHEADRRAVPLPEAHAETFPSDPRGFQITAMDAVAAWEELIFSLLRYGRTVKLKKGGRRELLNVKVVVESIALPGPERIGDYPWLSIPALQDYQREILTSVCPEDTDYTYGARMRSHFGLDGLIAAAGRLAQDSQSRHAYLALWDSRRDLTAARGHPCLVSVFFRKNGTLLDLTATFRTHNALDAWPVNFYGLASVLRFVAKGAGMAPGGITVFSQSISISASELARAEIVRAAWEQTDIFRLDPRGAFVITVDPETQEIVVQHQHEGVLLKEYRSKKSQRLQQDIARDRAVSDINHAIYLGRELMRAELALAHGFEYVQS